MMTDDTKKAAKWCPGRDLNPHSTFAETDFKSTASTCNQEQSGIYDAPSAHSGSIGDNSSDRRNDRRRGSGGVYLRGRVWWIFYSVAGVVKRESSKSEVRSDAEDLLNVRLGRSVDSSGLRPQGNDSLARLVTRDQTFLTIGTISELAVSVDLLNRGYSVYRSLSPNGPCDLVCIDPATQAMLRVEVKTGEMRGNSTVVVRKRSLRVEKFDVLAVVTRTGGIRYSKPIPAPAHVPPQEAR